jgi:hypothetical protein
VSFALRYGLWRRFELFVAVRSSPLLWSRFAL